MKTQYYNVLVGQQFVLPSKMSEQRPWTLHEALDIIRKNPDVKITLFPNDWKKS